MPQYHLKARTLPLPHSETPCSVSEHGAAPCLPPLLALVVLWLSRFNTYVQLKRINWLICVEFIIIMIFVQILILYYLP